ncbi:hypothetical protein [Formosa sp. A9]|uniref:hypothetical protein n=1 Tax=Formosa sp. A9 TaxID=3442641 RepID=UPI003EBDA32C
MKRFIIQIFKGLFFFIVINVIVNFYYEYSSYKAIYNKTHKNYLKWVNIHKKKNNFEIIILGTSRAYSAYNPKIIDSILNTQSFNMGTSAQDIAESYYTLKEIYEYQSPKYIFLDVFLPSSDNSHDFSQVFSNASFFSSFENKSNLIIEGFGKTGVLNYFIPVLKFNNHMKQDLLGVFAKNKTPRKEDNWINGYLYDTTTVSLKNIKDFKPISNFNNTQFNEDRFLKYFNKIKDICNNHNTKLICIRAPYPPTRLQLSKKDEENLFFKEFMKNQNTPYYDLNTFKSNTYFYNDEDFADYHHANYKAANKASKQVTDILMNNF